MATKLPRITYEDKKDYKVVDHDETYRISAKDMNDIKNTFNQSADAIEQAVDDVNETTTSLNEHIENGDFIPKLSIGKIETGLPGTDAEVSIDGTKEAPVINMTLPAGHDGKGQTTIRKDGELVQDLELKTERTENPTKVVVQLQDTSGNAVYIESTTANVYLTGSDGSEITQQNLNEKLGQLINLVAFYSSPPKAILDDLKKFIPTIK